MTLKKLTVFMMLVLMVPAIASAAFGGKIKNVRIRERNRHVDWYRAVVVIQDDDATTHERLEVVMPTDWVDTEVSTQIVPLELFQDGEIKKYRSGKFKRNKKYKAKSGTLTINIYESGSNKIVGTQDIETAFEAVPLTKEYLVTSYPNGNPEFGTEVVVPAPVNVDALKEILAASDIAETHSFEIKELEKEIPDVPYVTGLFNVDGDLISLGTHNKTWLNILDVDISAKLGNNGVWVRSWQFGAEAIRVQKLRHHTRATLTTGTVLESIATGEKVAGLIKRRTKGGFVTDIGGIEALLPTETFGEDFVVDEIYYFTWGDEPIYIDARNSAAICGSYKDDTGTKACGLCCRD